MNRILPLVLSAVLIFSGCGIINTGRNEPDPIEYEAILYLRDDIVECIATVSKSIDDYEDGMGRRKARTTYIIETILLPYGETIELYQDYEPDHKTTIYVGDVDCEIKLVDEASEGYFEEMQSRISYTGSFCASKDEDVYHTRSCQYAKSISAENKMYFDTEKEAELYGFRAGCESCYAGT